MLRTYHESISGYRQRDIVGLTNVDEMPIRELFTIFEKLLGPVGAGKCMHLLAPRIFPLRGREIASAYGLPLDRKGENAERYWRFMQITKEQVMQLGDGVADANLLKILDEYNHCVFTRRIWLPDSLG